MYVANLNGGKETVQFYIICCLKISVLGELHTLDNFLNVSIIPIYQANGND